MNEVNETTGVKDGAEDNNKTLLNENGAEEGVSMQNETQLSVLEKYTPSVSAEKAEKERKMSLDDMFNPDVKIVYDSDGEEEVKDCKEEDQLKSESSEESDTSSVSSESESDSDSGEEDKDKEAANDDFEEEGMEGPIISKNEITNEKVETLPDDFKIEADVPINYVGTITGVVEQSIIVKGEVSAEERVLNTGTVLCLEDRTPLGYLYEVFGRLQSPVYRIKFNEDDGCGKYKDLKGQKVFFVVPSANYLWTKQIRSMKGTDASNANDEELPEDEQEFSDDELEAAAKKQKNKRKNKSSKTSEEKKQKTKGAAKLNGLFTSLPAANKKTLPPPPISILPTNNIKNQNTSQYNQQNSIPTNGTNNTTNFENLSQTSSNINAIEMMKRFVQIFEQTQKVPQLSQLPLQNANFPFNAQPGHQQELPQQSFQQTTNSPLPHQHITQPNVSYPQHGYQLPGYQQFQPMFNPYPQHGYNPQFNAGQAGQHMMSNLQQQQLQQHHYQQQPNMQYQQFSQPGVYNEPGQMQSQQQEIQQASQQTTMHNISPNQTDTSLILAQLSNKISNQADNLASRLQSQDDEYDPANA